MRGLWASSEQEKVLAWAGRGQWGWKDGERSGLIQSWHWEFLHRDFHKNEQEAKQPVKCRSPSSSLLVPRTHGRVYFHALS